MTSVKTRIKMYVLWREDLSVRPDDLSLKIRIQGYKAVVQMSREQPGSVERNVDVLVQLLQSGESLYGREKVVF